MEAFIKRLFTFLYVMAITALLVLPRLKYSFTYVQVVLISLPLIVLAFIEGKKYRSLLAINVISLAIMFLFTFVFNFGGSVGNTVSAVISMYLYTLPLLICQYLLDTGDKQLMKWISVATCAMLVYIMLVTFKEFSVDPTIARKLAYGTYDDAYITYQRMKNVGGFGFCYCLGMFAPYLTSVIERTKGKAKAFSLACLFILLVFSVYSQYTTLVLLAVASIFYVVLTQGKMSVKKIIILVIMVVMIVSIRSIFWFLANNLSLSTLSSHFYDLYYILEGEEDLDRWNMYKLNLRVFWHNPIVGADLTQSYNEWVTTHAHSTIFSKLSSGGLVGIGTFAGFFGSAWYYLTKKNELRRLIPVFLAYIILAVLNPVAPEISVTAFMIIPIIEYQFVNKEEQLYV